MIAAVATTTRNEIITTYKILQSETDKGYRYVVLKLCDNFQPINIYALIAFFV